MFYLLALIFKFNLLFAEEPKRIDFILTSVNEQVVLFSDLQKAVLFASEGHADLNANGELRGSLTPQDVERIWQDLIDQRILTIQVANLGISVLDDELESEIVTFLKNKNVSREQLMEQLKSANETYDSYKEGFRRQIETERFIGKVIKPLVTVTDEEVKKFYLQKSLHGNNSVRKVNLRHIIVNMNGDESQQKQKQEILNKIQQEIKANTSFEKLVKLYSEAPDAIQSGGLLSARAVTSLPKEVVEKLQDPQPNTVVGPVTLGGSVFFFEYLGESIDNNSEFERLKPDLERQLQEIKFQERLKTYLESERAKVKINKRSFAVVSK